MLREHRKDFLYTHMAFEEDGASKVSGLAAGPYLELDLAQTGNRSCTLGDGWILSVGCLRGLKI